MNTSNLITAIKNKFPNFSIVEKQDSLLMRFIGALLFFNPRFMTVFTTTLGSTIYVPSVAHFETRPISTSITLLHEVIHVNDAQKYNKFIFGFLYLTPQILSLFFLPLLLVSWKFVFGLLFLTPIPSYFRMKFEKRAYLAQLYVTYKFNKLGLTNLSLEDQKEMILPQFNESNYYWMWVFKSLEKEFDDAIIKIMDDQRPYDDEVFDLIDDLINEIVK